MNTTAIDDDDEFYDADGMLNKFRLFTDTG